eukprot:7669793-Ditylum_brightwellii.AAC.2
MSQPFDPALSIKDFFGQLDKRQMLMDEANTPFTENQLVTRAFNLMFVTGVHNDACKEWRRKAPANKTWINVCTHFTDAHKELMELLEAVQQAGYTANMAEVNIHKQMAEVLSQLYAATEEDRSTVTNQTTTNLKLMEQVANLTTKLSTKDEEIKALQHSLEELTATI